MSGRSICASRLVFLYNRTMKIKIKVYPNSKKNKIVEKAENIFEAHIKAKPKEGRANQALLELLAGFFDVLEKDIKLIKGFKNRNKVFEIKGITSQTDKAVEVLQRGGIIAYPTDTIYGIGCNVFNEIAVKKLLKLKGRNFKNPMSVAVSDIQMLKSIAFLSKENEKIIKTLLPGPFTFIFRKKSVISDLITANLNTVGIRIPDNDMALAIIKKAGFPIITTSANFSGKEPAISPEQVDLKVDFMVKGECKYKKASSVIDLENRKIIREGKGGQKVKNILNL